MSWKRFCGASWSNESFVLKVAALLVAGGLFVPLPGRAEEPAKAPAAAAAEPKPFVYRVTGLFSPDRVEDLKAVMKEMPDVVLQGVDYEKAEATFAFDAAKVFPGAKPHQVLERLDNRVRTLSRSTFGLRAPSELPREKQERLEIQVRGLDCKGCCLGAYEAIYKIDGVQQATASFKEGLVVAWIDPAKTDRGKLEAALKQRGVEISAPPTPPEKPAEPGK